MIALRDVSKSDESIFAELTMRTEKEMFDLILSIASNDERIRAVYMNGSRANPNVDKDIYQDYDIVFMVTETKSFLDDKNWIKVFGEPAIIQQPNKKEPETYYTWAGRKQACCSPMHPS